MEICSQICRYLAAAIMDTAIFLSASVSFLLGILCQAKQEEKIWFPRNWSSCILI